LSVVMLCGDVGVLVVGEVFGGGVVVGSAGL